MEKYILSIKVIKEILQRNIIGFKKNFVYKKIKIII